MNSLFSDISYGIRSLLKRPGLHRDRGCHPRSRYWREYGDF